jgi:hypothetical protein
MSVTPPRLRRRNLVFPCINKRSDGALADFGFLIRGHIDLVVLDMIDLVQELHEISSFRQIPPALAVEMFKVPFIRDADDVIGKPERVRLTGIHDRVGFQRLMDKLQVVLSRRQADEMKIKAF